MMLETPAGGAAYKYIDPSYALVVRIEFNYRQATGYSYHTTHGEWPRHRVEQYRRGPQNFDTMPDRFFWMMWEYICRQEAFTFRNFDWGKL